MARDIPEDMRRTVKVQLRLPEKVARVLAYLPRGERSKWVAELIWKHREKILEAKKQ